MNSLLSDFIKKATEDTKIYVIENYTCHASKDSLSYIKMYTPLVELMKDKIHKIENFNVDYSKIDQTLSTLKGYSELTATKETDKIILRFNNNAFRNNYNLLDLTKMDLTFYCVRAGKMHERELNIEKELNLLEEKEVSTISDLEKQDDNNSNQLTFYDVILAGLKESE